jgi:hypothetical protein
MAAAGLLVGAVVLYPVPDFRVQVQSLATGIIDQGDEALFVVTVKGKSGYDKSVALDITKEIPGVSVDFLPRRGRPLPEFSSRVRVRVSGGSPAGPCEVTIRATGEDSKVRTVPVELRIGFAGNGGDTEDDGDVRQSIDLSSFSGLWQANVNVIPFDELKYAGIFGGLRDTVFFAFNPPWKIEGSAGSREWNRALAVHRERYESGVVGKYLMLDPDALERAREFWGALQEETQVDLNKVIDVRFLRFDGDCQHPTYFLWEMGTSVCVIYPTAFVVDGRPELVMQVVDSDLVSGLLRKQFNQVWVQATKVQAVEKAVRPDTENAP